MVQPSQQPAHWQHAWGATAPACDVSVARGVEQGSEWKGQGLVGTVGSTMTFDAHANMQQDGSNEVGNREGCWVPGRHLMAAGDETPQPGDLNDCSALLFSRRNALG